MGSNASKMEAISTFSGLQGAISQKIRRFVDETWKTPVGNRLGCWNAITEVLSATKVFSDISQLMRDIAHATG